MSPFILLMLKRVKSNANTGIALCPTKSYHFRDSLPVNLEMLIEPVMLDQGVRGKMGKGGGVESDLKQKEVIIISEVQGQDNVYFLHIWKGVLVFSLIPKCSSGYFILSKCHCLKKIG